MSIDHGKVLQLASEADAYANDLLSEDGDGPSDYQIATGMHDIAARLRALAQPAEAVAAWPKWLQDECLTVLRNMDTELRATGRVSNRIQQLINVVAGMKPMPPHDSAQGAVAFASSADLERLQGVGPGRFLTIPLWRVQGAGVADTPLYPRPQAAPAQGDGWRLCYSAVIHALAAIVNVRCPDKLFDLDAIPRGPVMDQVVLIREAMDRFGKTLAAAPSQEGES